MAEGKGSFRAPRGSLALKHFCTISAGSELFRVQESTHQSCVFFDMEPRHRYNAPGRQYGTCYLGTSPEVALIESVLHHLTTASSARSTTFVSDVERLSPWGATVLHDLRLVDVHGRGLALNHIDLQIATGRHATARAWSLAIWKDPANVDGIHYPARHNTLLTCVAIYSERYGEGARSSPVFEESRCGPLLDRKSQTCLPEFARFLAEYATIDLV